MFKLHNGGDFIEFYVDAISDTPAEFAVKCRVKSGGFSGVCLPKISPDRLAVFARDLLQLEKHKVGEATLLSDNLGELDICLRPTGLLETLMLATGSLTYLRHLEHGPILHQLSFGFEFHANMLSAMIQAPWVQQLTT